MKRSTVRKMIGLYVVLGLIIVGMGAFMMKQRSDISIYDNAYRNLKSLTHIGDYASAHDHADFQMYINGRQIDFTKEDYQERNVLVHMETPDVSPFVIHTHATGITYGMFFETIGIMLADCLTINDKEFCDGNDRSIKYYLNGKIVPDLAHTVVHDLDKVLISYGSESVAEIQTQLNSIGNHACEQSGKC